MKPSLTRACFCSRNSASSAAAFVISVRTDSNSASFAAEIAETSHFYVIDADAILLDDFKFDYFPTVWDEDTVHVWKSRNPINGLVYGFGGLKLFPTQLLRDAKEWRVDFTTSISDKFKPMPATANYTAFNTNPYDTWKSAFRECTKLSSSVIHRSKQGETDERLEIWCTVNNDAKFGEYAIAGANAGREYGTTHAGDDDALSKITKDDLKALISEPYFIPSGTPLYTQMQHFQDKQERVGLIVNEHGEFIGLISLEDILEEIVGEFNLDFLSKSSKFSQDDDGGWIVDGSVTIRTLNKKLNLQFPIDGPKTLNGLVLEYFEDIPEPNTSFKIANHTMEVLQSHDRIVKSIKIYPLS